MKYLKKLGEILSSTCCIFTAIVFLVFGVTALASEQVSAFPAESAALFFVFALIFSIANKVFSLKNLSIIWRVALHLALTLTDLILCLFVFTGYYKEKGTFTVGCSIAYVIIYLVITCVVLLIRSKIRSKKDSQTPYKSQFSEKKKK